MHCIYLNSAPMFETENFVSRFICSCNAFIKAYKKFNLLRETRLRSLISKVTRILRFENPLPEAYELYFTIKGSQNIENNVYCYFHVIPVKTSIESSLFDTGVSKINCEFEFYTEVI